MRDRGARKNEIDYLEYKRVQVSGRYIISAMASLIICRVQYQYMIGFGGIYIENVTLFLLLMMMMMPSASNE
jgi:hypothetical protein